MVDWGGERGGVGGWLPSVIAVGVAWLHECDSSSRLVAECDGSSRLVAECDSSSSSVRLRVRSHLEGGRGGGCKSPRIRRCARTRFLGMS